MNHLRSENPGQGRHGHISPKSIYQAPTVCAVYHDGFTMMGALRPPRSLTSSTSSLRLQEVLSVGWRSTVNHRVTARGTVINSDRAANKVTGTPCELGQSLPFPFARRAIILPPFNSRDVLRINELGRVPVLNVLVALTFWGQRSL